ncbi:MAG: permease [Firmicutes bacterium]|nr:permease [Bacillota bacterium]
MNKRKAQSLFRRFLPVGVVLIIVLALSHHDPHRGRAVAGAAGGYLVEMMKILPAVVLLMGLIDVWVPKALIQRYLGQEAGWRGVLLALAFGTAPTGPLYIAFPIASGLLQKGARLSNVVIFLGTWAAAKIPQVMVEAKFLGLSFALLRLVLTLGAILAMGYLMEAFGKVKVPTKGVEEE